MLPQQINTLENAYDGDANFHGDESLENEDTNVSDEIITATSSSNDTPKTSPITEKTSPDTSVIASPETPTKCMKRKSPGLGRQDQVKSRLLEVAEIEHEQKMKNLLLKNDILKLKKQKLELLDRENSPRILNTHMPFRWLPKKHLESGGKIIHVRRNPKDVSVSAFHHFLSSDGTGYGDKNMTWQQFFDNVVVGNVPLYDGWFKYEKDVEFAKGTKQGASIHSLLYERLILDPVIEIKQLAQFLGLPISNELAEEIADQCSLEKLRTCNKQIPIDFFKMFKEMSEQTKTSPIKPPVIYRKDIQAGRVDVVFCSPESITQKYWMRILKEGKLRDQLSVLVFDEAHCISEWGLDFRPDYRSVSDLVSILDHIPTLLLTATATKAIQRDLNSLLALPASTKVVARIPDRPNIYLHIEQAVERVESLQWTIDHLSRYGIKSKKILVYCRTLRSCQTLYMWCMENLGDKACLSSEHLVKDRLVDMFHSKAHQETVSRIMNDFPKEESVIRLLFSTVAFGLGVQIDSIDIVVHYGIESSTLSYWQEIGRCARDGRPGLAITYAFKRSVNDCDDANMKEVATSTNCIRSLLLRIFILQGSDSIDFQHSECDMKCEFWCKCSYCLCCSNCHKNANVLQR
ncbi:hypothetical protein FSP39_002286 [Pinctada imbricata]|uniref:DNA 3'-5' helicase n=1 Tax=Pinctada imbricata TaxID=66713 RepID=A0AA88YPH3_PINIB|nr:hypothetical protein FSP39_002286 [Pinctada imbricata]